jgi:hypothetical protein
MARAANTRPPEPTLEQLNLALRQLWRPGYPRTVTEALAHPTFGTCVKGLARNIGRRGPQSHQAHSLPSAPVPPTPTAPRAVPRNRAGGGGNSIGLWLRPNPPQWIDGKRLAANDRDDD